MTHGLLVSLALALALFGAVLLVAEILRRRLRAYTADIGYDVRADHCFRFDPAFGRSVDLAIDGDAVTLPEFTAGEDSAFLEPDRELGIRRVAG